MKSKMKILVFADDQKTLNKYIRMFYIMHRDQIKDVKRSNKDVVLMTEKLSIHFYTITTTRVERGLRAHYVINLSKNKTEYEINSSTKVDFDTLVEIMTPFQKIFEDEQDLPHWMLDEAE
ncbi:hypothetical protein [Shouchella clausii]|uniref:hypothetical protein n=1 Tax=Shouchella clausii TaxID=79880 RepID=UPI001C73CF3D|nr:hypothetical protein [Shouchella clausii]MBX0320260.1 hypothetical protein [Shouchella clausii]MEB5480723.1 hypothetical protein [Shouchella clausii]